jgi:hypothetical protein
MSQLPHGSSLDSKKGIFYWQPGLAFSGKYRLEFLVKSPGGTMKRKTLQVNIHPRYSRKIWKTQ